MVENPLSFQLVNKFFFQIWIFIVKSTGQRSVRVHDEGKGRQTGVNTGDRLSVTPTPSDLTESSLQGRSVVGCSVRGLILVDCEPHCVVTLRHSSCQAATPATLAVTPSIISLPSQGGILCHSQAGDKLRYIPPLICTIFLFNVAPCNYFFISSPSIKRHDYSVVIKTLLVNLISHGTKKNNFIIFQYYFIQLTIGLYSAEHGSLLLVSILINQFKIFCKV